MSGEEGRNPVVLVHGIYNSGGSMGVMKRWLARRGWEVYAPSLKPNDGTGRLEDLAGQLEAYVDRSFPGSRRIDLVGFSMGGLVCRYYVQRMGGAGRVDRLILISAPNHGTRLACLTDRAGCLEMRPGSAFLRDLNGNLETLKKVKVTSIWTPLDLAIVPASSSRAPFGTETRKWVALHPLMILLPGCFKAVAAGLSQPL